MKRISLLAVFSLSVPLIWAALPATDSFNNGAANVLLNGYSGNWAFSIGNFQVVGNAAAAYSSVPAMASWNADSVSADHYSKATLNSGAYGGNGVAARVTPSGNGYYAYIFHLNYVCCVIHVGRLDGGTEVELAASSGAINPATGDVLEIEVSGSSPVNIRVTLSHSTKGDMYDNTLTDSSGMRKTSGAPGIYGHSSAASTITLDAWEGGSLGATPDSMTVRRRILR